MLKNYWDMNFVGMGLNFLIRYLGFYVVFFNCVIFV